MHRRGASTRVISCPQAALRPAMQPARCATAPRPRRRPRKRLADLEFDAQIAVAVEAPAQQRRQPVAAATIGIVAPQTQCGRPDLQRRHPSVRECPLLRAAGVVQPADVRIAHHAVEHRREAVRGDVQHPTAGCDARSDVAFDRIAVWPVVVRDHGSALGAAAVPRDLRVQPAVSDRAIQIDQQPCGGRKKQAARRSAWPGPARGPVHPGPSRGGFPAMPRRRQTIRHTSAGTSRPPCSQLITIRRGGCAHSSSERTCSAIANALVNPGDSMPNRLTSPRTPCSAGPCSRKSRAGSPGRCSFGRMPA